MSRLFPAPPFTGFGPNAFDLPPPSLQAVRGRRASILRDRVREQCPRHPGVYGMIDANGVLIYVGKAKQLRARLACYFRPRSRDPKAGRILKQTRRIIWEPAPNEFAALLRELELIRRWRPRLNVIGQPERRRRTYVCLGRRPAPYLFLARQPPAGATAFGPIPAGRTAREAVRWLNDAFRLRDCPQKQVMRFSEESELFHTERAAGCLRYEIGTCLGPCAAACSWVAYREQVRQARAFLCGKDNSLLDRLEEQMAGAAATLEYERAGILRDKRDALAWVRDQIERVRLARTRQSFIYPIEGIAGEPIWYVIHRGRVECAFGEPIDAASRQTAADRLQQVYERASPWREPTTAPEVEDILLVAAWFRRHPAERVRTWKPSEALERLHDGSNQRCQAASAPIRS